MSNKLDRWDTRLHNWALYFHGGSTDGRSMIDRFDCDDHNPNPCYETSYETREIALVGEAIDTDEVVQRLGEIHRKTVTAYYSWSGTKEMIAAQLRIHRDTLWQRIHDAKQELDRLWTEKRRAVPKPPSSLWA